MSEIVIKEKLLNGYPDIISYECTKKIIEQMEKNICKIKIGNEQGTGFFCKIPYNNKIVLMTNNHVIDENKKEINIKIKEEKRSRIIDLNNRIKYTNEEYDITIIEMNEKDNINNYLELDNNIINELNEELIDKTIYIIQYPEGELSVSYGILDNIHIDKKYNFNHRCATKGGSSGAPILNIKNNKLIGIHKESSNKRNNRGLFLNYPIKEYLQLYYNKLQEFNNLNIQQDTTKIYSIDNAIINGGLKESSINKLHGFNKKYNLNIQQDTTKIDLRHKEIGNEGLKDLCRIEFKELKELYLCENNISNIKVLENAKFEKLEILNLGNNKISDINILERVKLKELKELYLYENNISDIKVLQNIKFEKLEILNLGNNKISNINILEKIRLKELKKIYLYHNNIYDIKVLEKVKIEKLEILDLGGNKISDINILEKVKLKELKELYLYENNISNVKVLENAKFEKLEILNLGNNKISDINILEKVKLKELKKLYLYGNNISDVKVLENIKLEKLEIINLENNKIKNKAIISNLKIKNIKF